MLLLPMLRFMLIACCGVCACRCAAGSVRHGQIL
jgi:hypothetical protein